MSRTLGLLVIAACFLPGIPTLSLSQDTKTEGSRSAVAPLGGDLRVWRVGTLKLEKLAAPSAVAPEDHIGAANKGTGRLAVGSEVVITLKGVDAGPEEGLSVLTGDKNVQLKLYRGRILVESFDVQVAVDTPAGRAEGRSVALMVEATEEGTRIVPIDGQLKVTNSLGALDATPGETVSVKKGAAPAKKHSGVADGDLGWATEVEGSPNLIPNPGFEEGLKSWMAVTVNGKSAAKLDRNIAHSGNSSVRIDLQNESLVDMKVDSGFDAGNCIVYQNGPIAPGKYLLRLWVRTENYTVKSKDAGLAISLGTRALVCPPAAGQWRCARFIVELAPQEFTRLRFPVNPEGSKDVLLNGTVWVDDVSLILIKSK
jgi:hypothetical protein